MSSAVRRTTPSRTPRTHHSRHQPVEVENGTPRRSTRPYDYASAVSPGREGAMDAKRHRDGSARSPRPEANGHYYPGDAVLRRQSTQRPGVRRGSIDPDQYRRPSPVRHAEVSPVRSPRRARGRPTSELRESSSRRRRRHEEDDAAPPTSARPSSRAHRSRSRPDSAVRPHRSSREEEVPAGNARAESRHRSRSRKVRDESSHRRSRSRRHEREREVPATTAAAAVPLASRQNTGRYVSPPDRYSRGAGEPLAAAASASSGRRSARRPASPPPPPAPHHHHHVDPAPLTSSSRPPAAPPRSARDPASSAPSPYYYGNGGSRTLPGVLSSPQRQRSGSHIEVLSISSLHGPSLASLGGAGSDMYVQTPLTAPQQRPRSGRPYISPSPNQPSDMLEDRIEETREWMAELKQQVARDRAMERADAALAAADVNRFLADLRRTESITAPSEMEEPQRLYWRTTSPASTAAAPAAPSSSRRERARPAETGFQAAPRTTAAALEPTPERRHQSARRRERERDRDREREREATGSSQVTRSHDAAPAQRSRSRHKDRPSSTGPDAGGSSAKKSRADGRARESERDRDERREEKPRHASTHRRRADKSDKSDSALAADSEAAHTSGRATSTHPPPPGVPASRTASQSAWQTALAPPPPDGFEEENIIDMVATPASQSEVASTRAPAETAQASSKSAPLQPHSRQSSGPPTAPPPEKKAKSSKKSSKPRPPPTPSDIATTASETALETDNNSPVPKPVERDTVAPAAASHSHETDDRAGGDGEPEYEDVYFLSFMDGSRFLSTDELCQYNVFMAESLSDANLHLLREVVFNQDDVLFAEVLYGDDIQAELAQIEVLLRDAAQREGRPTADVEDEIWEDQKAAIQRFNNKATVALEAVHECGSDFVEALESAAVAYHEQQLKLKEDEQNMKDDGASTM